MSPSLMTPQQQSDTSVLGSAKAETAAKRIRQAVKNGTQLRGSQIFQQHLAWEL